MRKKEKKQAQKIKANIKLNSSPYQRISKRTEEKSIGICLWNEGKSSAL